jgi:transcriptional regulator NrdR family protein
MKCPTCDTWTIVKETRTRTDGSKRRTYACANEHKFRTSEEVVAVKRGAKYEKFRRVVTRAETK